MKVIGAGLACLDIINEENNITIMNGGTCANVLTALAQLGNDVSMLLPHYSEDIRREEFYQTFKRLNVHLLSFGRPRKIIPRIVETYDDNFRHMFYTKCPKCKKDLIKNRYITKRETEEVLGACKECDVFFIDRISDGIKEIVQNLNVKRTKIFYEPNSCRNINALIEMAKKSSILKFSTERISMNSADIILSKCQDSMLEMIIATHGKAGLSYCYKRSGGGFSAWLDGPRIDFKSLKDTSGAGDWLTAGFLHYWSQTEFELSMKSIYNALEEALRLSEIASMTNGAQGVFYDKEVLKILKAKYSVKLETTLELYKEHVGDKRCCDFCLSRYED